MCVIYFLSPVYVVIEKKNYKIMFCRFSVQFAIQFFYHQIPKRYCEGKKRGFYVVSFLVFGLDLFQKVGDFHLL